MMPVSDELIDRVMEGEASKSEIAEVQQWLESPASLERFARRAELHADVRRSLQRKDILANALDGCSEEIDDATISAKTISPKTISPKTSPFVSRRVQALAAAGLATAVCILLIFMPNRVKEVIGPSKSRVAYVAMDVDAFLTKDEQLWKDASLPVGSYRLREGLLNLRFGNGVMVYIEAPAKFDAISEKRISLYSGRLSANVPPAGIGFTVDTPEAKVVDFGTEFSVDVESDASEVHVFEGLVRVHTEAAKDGGVPESVELQASQAVRISGEEAKPVNIKIARDRFIRNFDEPKRKYARSVKELAPLAYYRMPLRVRGMVCEPPQHSGVILTGAGMRPPYVRGVLTGGALRVGADSTGRGGRVDSPPTFRSGNFSLVVFVYLETPERVGMVATNMGSAHGSFALLIDEKGMLKATIKTSNGEMQSVTGEPLPVKTWRHIVVTADGERLQLFDDGKLVASARCSAVAPSTSDSLWFGTDAKSARLWHGRIDEVALFDKALSQETINNLYRTAQDEIGESR